jgi:hypothetical protein
MGYIVIFSLSHYSLFIVRSFFDQLVEIAHYFLIGYRSCAHKNILISEAYRGKRTEGHE